MGNGSVTDDELVTAIRKGVAMELEARARIDAETHRHHHEWTQSEIERRKRCQDMREKVVQHVLGWGAVLGVGFVGKAIWDAAMTAKEVIK